MLNLCNIADSLLHHRVKFNAFHTHTHNNPLLVQLVNRMSVRRAAIA